QTAIHKAENLRKRYHRQARDVRREGQVAPHRAEESEGGDILERGKKVPQPEGPIKRPYHYAIEPNPRQIGAADSFFSDGPVELMVHGASPDEAALVIDLVNSLKEHDGRQGDCLQQIVRLSLEGHAPAEIAAKLGVSKRTIERKRELIAELW